MPDYQKAKIYAIMSPDTQDIYIGSTCWPLNKRLAGHKNDYKRGRNCTSKKIIELGTAYIKLIKEYPCNTKEELLMHEGEIIKNTENCINQIIAGRKKEWWNDPVRKQEYYNEYLRLKKLTSHSSYHE